MGKAEIMVQAEHNTKLVVLKDVQPVALLESSDLDGTLEAIKKEVNAEIHDVNTEEGRKNIKTLTAKIGKSLRFVEKAALDHARELKAAPKIFDGKRKIFKDFMEALKDNTERPLIEYQEAEKAHALEISKKVQALMIADVAGTLVEGVDTLEGALAWKKKALETVIDESFEDQAEGAEKFRQQSLLMVDGLIAKYEKEAQEAAEAEKARLEQEAKERKEYEERVAREAKEAAKIESLKAIADANARAEQARIDAERREKEAEAQAIIDKENAVKAEAARVQKIADDKAQAEQVRLSKIAHAEATKKEAEEKKAASAKHRRKIYDEILASMEEQKIDPEFAKEFIKMIAEGKIKHVSINFIPI